MTADVSETGTEDPNFTGPTSTPVEEGLTLTIILIPVVLVVLIITTIVICIFVKRRWSNKAGTQGTSITAGVKLLLSRVISLWFDLQVN